MADALTELTLLVGAEAAVRIARTFGLLVSPDSLLDAVKAKQSSPAPTPRVLGVDDFAFRKGQRYGTILVDLEGRYPIDLLPDREPETLVKWLKEHPGVQVISRDRGAAYREGATRGAPDALQVADRFHLIKNLGDALEHFLLHHHGTVRTLAKTLARESVDAAEQNGAFPPLADPLPCSLTPAQQREKQVRRSRRLERYEQVKQMEGQGLSRHEIARRMGMSRNTVRRFLEHEQFPEIAQKPPRRSKLTPFVPHLRQRWIEGCYDATRLFQEIVAQGFGGSLDLVQRCVASWREAPRSRKTGRHPPPVIPACGHLSFVLMNPEHPKVTESMRAFAQRLTRENPLLGQAQALAGEFCRLVRERAVGGLPDWLEAVAASDIGELKGFAVGLVQDRAAVEAALSSEWSNGQVEGQVNRLKFLKRSMYGRGSFDLLRARVLHRAKATT